MIFLLFLASPCLLAQNSYLDSLETRFSTEKSDVQKLELLNEMVAIAFRSDLRQALGYAKRGVSLAEQSGNKNWQPRFYEMQGRMHANLLQLDSASLRFGQAMKGYLAVDNQRGQATTAFKIAWVHRKKGDIEQAMNFDLSLLTRQLSGSMWEEVKNGTTIYFDFHLKRAL